MDRSGTRPGDEMNRSAALRAASTRSKERRSIRDEPVPLRTVKLSPALITWLFHKTCTTLRSSGVVAES